MARKTTILTVLLFVASVAIAPAAAGGTVGADDASPGAEFTELQTSTDEMDGNESDDMTDDDGMDTSNETDDSATDTDEMDGDDVDDGEMDDDGMDDEMTETGEMNDSMTDTDEATDGMSEDGMDDDMQEDADEGVIGSIGQPGFGLAVGVLATALAAGLLARRER